MRLPVLLLVMAMAGSEFVCAQAPDKTDKPTAEKPAPKTTPLIPLGYAGKQPERAEQLRQIQAQYQQACEEFVEALSAAKTAQEKHSILQERMPPLASYVLRCQRLVEADPKDDIALATLAWMLRFGAATGKRSEGPLLPLRRPGDKEPPPFKPLDVLLEHHLNNPKLGPICQKLRPQTNGGPAFLQAVLDRGMVADTRGLACLRLAQLLHQQSSEKKLPADEHDRLLARAEQFYERAVKDFPQVKVKEDTFKGIQETSLKEIAGGVLFELRNLTIGKTLPELTSEGLDGKPVKLSDYRGKVVVLDVWATWCGPCRAMIPHERELVKRMEGKPFTLISVSCDEQKETLTKFLDKQPMPWEHWFGGRGGEISQKLRIKYYPTIYVLDGDGVIRYKDVRGKEMDDAVETLLREAAEKKGSEKKKTTRP